jgi:tight adherence protein B
VSALIAFLGGVLGVIGAHEALRPGLPALARRAPRALTAAASLLRSVERAGRDGRDPGTRERRRLLAAGALAALVIGWAALGPLAGLGLAALGPWGVGRVLRSRRRRHRQAVERGAAALALALADALSGGHSLRGAVAAAAPALDGATGRELRRVAGELALGVPTPDALETLRMRVRSHAIDTIVGAALLQRRAGGDLARLLRESARAFEDQQRLDEEVRAATAQARFTGLIVVLLPLGGALLTELASPGYLGRIAGSFLTAWLVGLALALQVVAAVAIRRLGRVPG